MRLFIYLFIYRYQIKAVGSVCRLAVNECDLDEYCTGLSENCPEDSFKMNGIACSSGNSYCYNGKCPSHLQHCQRLWGQGTYRMHTVHVIIHTLTQSDPSRIKNLAHGDLKLKPATFWFSAVITRVHFLPLVNTFYSIELVTVAVL